MKNNFKAIATKTMIATAIASMMAGAAFAADEPTNTVVSAEKDYASITYTGKAPATTGAAQDTFVTVTTTDDAVTANVNDVKGAYGAGASAKFEMELVDGTLNIFDGTISGFTGKIAESNSGALISADNTALAVDNLTVSGNKLTDNARGMIRVSNGGTLELSDSTFENNEGALGSAINFFKAGTSTIENTKFIGNKSTQHGGAIYITGITGENSAITISDSVFSGNTAAKQGGAMMVIGGTNVTNNVILDNVEFSNNVSNMPKAGSANQSAGGALMVNGNEAANTQVAAKDVRFTGNKAETANGGALAVIGQGVFTMDGGVFSGNTAAAAGAVSIYGGTASFTDVDFTNNKSTGWGGAIWVNGANSSLTFAAQDKDVVISGNTSGDTSTYTGKLYNGYTGGFLHLTTGNDATFNVADGRTFTIGTAGNTAHNVDSITSNYETGEGSSTSTITKTGAGDLVINSNMEAFEGDIAVEAGTLTLANGFGTYSITNQGNYNGNKALTATKSTLSVAENAEAIVNGTWLVTNGMTTSGAGDLSIANLVVSDMQYVKTNGTTAGTAAETKSASDTTVGNFTMSNTGDVTVGDLTVKGGYGETKATFTKNGSGDLEITGTLTIDKTLGSFTVSDGSLTTASANIYSVVDDKVVLKDGITKTGFAGADQLYLTDARTYTLDDWKAINSELSDGKLVVFENGEFVTTDGTMETFTNALEVGNVGHSAVSHKITLAQDATHGDLTAISAPVTVGSIAFEVEGGTVKTFNLGNDAAANVLTLRGDKSGNVITGLGDEATIQLKYVNFGEEAEDSGVLNNAIIVEGDKTSNVVGHFTFNKSVTANGTLGIQGVGVFNDATAGNFVVSNGGALVTEGVAAEDPSKDSYKHIGATINLTNGGIVVAGSESSLAAAQELYEKLVSEAEKTSTYARNNSGNVGLVVIDEQVAFDQAITGATDALFNLDKVAANGYTFDDGAIVSTATSQTAITSAYLQGINSQVAGYAHRTDEAKSIQLGTAFANAEVHTGSIFYGTGSSMHETDDSIRADENGIATFNVNDDKVDDFGILARENLRGDLQSLDFDRLTQAVAFYAYDGAYNQILESVDGNATDAGRIYSNLIDSIADAADTVSLMAVAGGAFSTAVDINNEVWKALDRRMTLANLNVARNATGITPWVDVIGTTNEAKDVFGGAGYEADIYGAVLGADWTASCGAILGLAVSVGQADANSVDLDTKVDNDVDFWGVSLYGSHRIGNVNGKFDLGYISTSNDLSANTILGRFDESLDADIFTFGLGAEYLASVGSLNVVPHAGIRWSRIDMDDSSFGADYDAMNLFQMPMGVTFSGTFDMTGWKVAPMVDISVVPAFGDKDAVSSFAGGIEDTTRVVDTNPIQMTLGVNAQVDAWTFGVNYGLTAGGDERLNNSFNLNARYTF